MTDQPYPILITGSRDADRTAAFWRSVLAADGTHTYLSTGCLHGNHAYCQSATGKTGAKAPAQCKGCGAPCICECHRGGLAAKAEPHTGLVVQPYRNDRHENAWVFRCWGTDRCDGWLSLDHTSQESAERARDRHVREEHATPGPAATEATEAETTARVFAALHRSAEQDVTRVIALYEQWVKAGAPPLGTSMSRWWDARLVELHDAIRPPEREQKEQPGA